MRTQSAKQNESKICRVFSLILPLLMLSAILSCAAQKQPAETPKVSEAWQITSSQIFGRYLQDNSFYQINSSGQTSLREKRVSLTTRERKEVRIAGKISAESVAELGRLIKKLDLPKAKAMPKKCIKSLHGPSFNFTIKIADQSYNVDSCDNKQQYGSTLISSQQQKEDFRQLREKARMYIDQTNKSITQTTPFTTPLPDASTGKIPSDAELQALLQKTIQDFADAVEAEDFTKFRENASTYFKMAPAAAYKKYYGYMHNRFEPHLRSTVGKTATFSREPSIGEFKLSEAGGKNPRYFVALNLNGSYEDSIRTVKFEIQYHADGKEWKISVINLWVSLKN